MNVLTVGFNDDRHHGVPACFQYQPGRAVEFDHLRARIGGQGPVHRDDEMRNGDASDHRFFQGQRLTPAIAVQHDVLIE